MGLMKAIVDQVNLGQQASHMKDQLDLRRVAGNLRPCL